MIGRRERLVLGGMLVVALALRVAWCLSAARLPSGSLHDPNFYYLYGQQLANGEGYRIPFGQGPTAYYPPGYPFSLGALFFIAYHTPLDQLRNVEIGMVVFGNILWQLGSIVLLFLIARKLTGRSMAGYLAAAAFALWPNIIFHTAVALTESLFIFLLLVAVWLVVDGPWRAPRWKTWRLVAIGVVLGAATLVRPVTIPIYPVLLLVLVLSRIGWRRAISQTAIVVGASMLVLLPWAVRNQIVMGSFTLSTNTGDNLCMSRRVGGSGGFEFPNERCFPASDLKRPEFELDRNAHGTELATEFVKDHPGEEARLVFRRLGATFVDDADGLGAVESYGTDVFMSSGTRDALGRTANVYALFAALIGSIGLVVLIVRRRTPAGVLVVLTGIGMLIPPLVFFGDPRFHVPAVPIAAIGIGCLVIARSHARGADGVVLRGGPEDDPVPNRPTL